MLKITGLVAGIAVALFAGAVTVYPVSANAFMLNDANSIIAISNALKNFFIYLSSFFVLSVFRPNRESPPSYLGNKNHRNKAIDLPNFLQHKYTRNGFISQMQYMENAVTQATRQRRSYISY